LDLAAICNLLFKAFAERKKLPKPLERRAFRAVKRTGGAIMPKAQTPPAIPLDRISASPFAPPSCFLLLQASGHSAELWSEPGGRPNHFHDLAAITGIHAGQAPAALERYG